MSMLLDPRKARLAVVVAALGCAPSTRTEPTLPTRIGFYVGTEGLTFSTDRRPQDRGPQHPPDAQTIVAISEASATAIVEQLEDAGFFNDLGRAHLGSGASDEVTFSIAVQSAAHTHDATFLNVKELSVPLEYVEILESQDIADTNPLAQRFSEMNRAPRVRLQSDESPFWAPRHLRAPGQGTGR